MMREEGGWEEGGGKDLRASSSSRKGAASEGCSCSCARTSARMSTRNFIPGTNPRELVRAPSS